MSAHQTFVSRISKLKQMQSLTNTIWPSSPIAPFHWRFESLGTRVLKLSSDCINELRGVYNRVSSLVFATCFDLFISCSPITVSAQIRSGATLGIYSGVCVCVYQVYLGHPSFHKPFSLFSPGCWQAYRLSLEARASEPLKEMFAFRSKDRWDT